jgi:hypothetical protein
VISLEGLGVTKSQAGGAAASAGLLTAGLLDPEPISKAFLLAAAGLSSLVAQAFSGCGSTCTQATQIVNQIEPYLKQNVANYLAVGTPRPKSVQQSALNVFNGAWQNVLTSCGNPSLGDAGTRCISDRNRGGKWDWFSYYYDPIANDANVFDDSLGTTMSSTVGNFATGIVSSLTSGSSWLVPALLVGVGALFIFGGRHDS